jgi:sulfite reductase (NADPH) hemoprotein beta-component
VPNEHLLAYLESIMRVYNRYGRRDNKYKARIKILVHEKGWRPSRGRSRPSSPKCAAVC